MVQIRVSGIFNSQLVFRLLQIVAGASGLALETIWIRELGLRLGNTVGAATAVTAVFFLCAAAGNLVGGRAAARSRQPGRLYGWALLLAGAAAVGLFPLRNSIYTLISILPLADPAAGALYALLLAGPTSFAWGCGLPALAERFVPAPDRRTTVAGVYYACELLGAAVGVLGGGLLLPAIWGYTLAFTAAGLLLMAAGLLALGNQKRAPEDPGSKTVAADAPPTIPDAPISPPFRILPLSFCRLPFCFASGLLTLALEMLCLAYLRLLTVSSLPVIGAALAAFILDLGLGAALVAWLRRGRWSAEKLLGPYLLASGVLIALCPMGFQEVLQRGLLPPTTSLWLDGARMFGAAVVLMLPALLAAGGVFPLCWEWAEKNGSTGADLGRMLSANKLGAALGAAGAPFLLMPQLGLPGAFVAVAAGYLLLVGIWALTREGGWKRGISLPLNLLLIAPLCLWMHNSHPAPVALEPGERLLDLAAGPGGVTAVTDNTAGSRRIILNQTYALNGTSRALTTQLAQMRLALALTPAPGRVLHIGAGSGVTPAVALEAPVTELLAAEIVPEVARMAEKHFGQWNAPLFADPRAKLVVGDGRRLLLADPRGFDLINVDLLHPAQESAGGLFSKDFFRLALEKLHPHGRFCLWLPLYQLDAAGLDIICRSFQASFAAGVMIRANFDPLQPVVGLLGAREKLDFSPAWRRQRLDELPTAMRQTLFLRGPDELALAIVGDLMEFKLSPGPEDSDDFPALAFSVAGRLAPGQTLRGLTWLRWLDTRLPSPATPSLAGAEPHAQAAAMQAGKLYYAAAVSAVPIPTDAAHQAVRQQRAQAYFAAARQAAPEIRLTPADLNP